MWFLFSPCADFFSSPFNQPKWRPSPTPPASTRYESDTNSEAIVKASLTWSNTFSGELSSWYDELDARLISILGVNGAIKLVVTAPVVDSCDCWLIWIDDGLFLWGKTPAGLPFGSMSLLLCLVYADTNTNFPHVPPVKFLVFVFSQCFSIFYPPFSLSLFHSLSLCTLTPSLKHRSIKVLLTWLRCDDLCVGGWSLIAI